MKQHMNMESEVVIPLVNDQGGQIIYHPSMLRLAILGGSAGGIALGVFGYLIASGILPIAYFGQFTAAGTAPAVFCSLGLGLAVGALAGALTALYRIPRKTTS
jgi:hypothetical protein